MQLSTALLSCLFILCAGRTIDRPLKYLKLDTGRVAAFSVLILAFGALNPEIIPGFSLNMGSMLILVIAGRLAYNSGESMSRAILYAIPASVFMFVMELYGLNVFAPLAFLPFLLVLPYAGAFLVAALSPMLMCVYSTALDLYLYGYAVMNMGTVQTLNLQVAGLYMAAATSLTVLYMKKRSRAGGL